RQLPDVEREQDGQEDRAGRGERVAQADEEEGRANGEEDVLRIVVRVVALKRVRARRRLHGARRGPVMPFERGAGRRGGGARLFTRHARLFAGDARLLVVGRRAAGFAEARVGGDVRAAVSTIHTSTHSFRVAPERDAHGVEQLLRRIWHGDEAARAQTLRFRAQRLA